MSNSSLHNHNDLFSSLISDIKTYTGKDPLLPWLRGIRKLRDSLPPHLLREKLPRFLQKCAQAFQTDRRYTNDSRYLRVWLQLMDFVDDPRAVLRTMEASKIGMKKSLFYEAYALYYVKMKKFEEADKMYQLGVQNLAEPINELQKSYEQFLHRMERHKKKRIQCQEGTKGKGLLCAGGLPPKCNDTKISNENICGVQGWPARTWTKESSIEKQHDHFNVENKVLEDNFQIEIPGKEYKHTRVESDEPSKFCGDDTVVVRFVNTAIVERSEAEDACHHGLVEPTINTKEALKAINSMFQEPLEPAVINRRSHRSCPKADKRLDNGFEIFVDASLDTEAGSSSQNGERDFELSQRNSFEANQSLQEPQPLQIYIDDEESNEVGEKINVKGTSEKGKLSAFVFPNPMDLPLDGSINQDSERSPKSRFREDTVVCRFVGTTISDEPQVENVCHHGLVEPTINLKEAMDDINNMFGKPIDFVRANRRKKQDKAPSGKNNCGGFAILPDDDLETPKGHSLPSSSANNESDLFEPTVCMKEAMAEINKMFGMPLDF